MHSLFTGTRRTRAQRLLRVLEDAKWHATQELVRRVGHSFGGAKFHLVRRGYDIKRRRHATKPDEHEYRLISAPRDRDEC